MLVLTIPRGEGVSFFRDGLLLGKVINPHDNNGPIKVCFDFSRDIQIVRDRVVLHGFTACEKDQEANT